jgi:hypothetical protein
MVTLGRAHVSCAVLALTLGLLARTPAVASAQLVNGGFEGGPAGCTPGDLVGWTAAPAPGGTVVVTAASSAGGTAYTPVEGQCFAVLETGQANTNTILSQAFAATEGDILTGYAYYDTTDYFPFFDPGQVIVMLTGTMGIPLFSEHVLTVGSFGSTPWTEFSFTIPATGTYSLVAKVKNSFDNSHDAYLGLDGFTLTPVATPELDSLLLFGLGGLALTGYVWRVRRQPRRRFPHLPPGAHPQG